MEKESESCGMKPVLRCRTKGAVERHTSVREEGPGDSPSHVLFYPDINLFLLLFNTRITLIMTMGVYDWQSFS